MRFPSLLLLLFLVPLGCSDDPSPIPTTADYPPANISLYTQLQSNGALAQISVTANTPGGVATLGAGDSLLFRVPNGPSQTLTAYDFSLFGQLETASTSFELVFSRGTSSFVMPLQAPPAFALVGPEMPVSRSSPILLSWGPPGTNFETWLDIDGPCLVWAISRYFDGDVANYEIQPADLSMKPNTTDCELRVWVTRSATAGTVDSALGPSAAPGAFSIRSVSIATTP